MQVEIKYKYEYSTASKIRGTLIEITNDFVIIKDMKDKQQWIPINLVIEFYEI